MANKFLADDFRKLLNELDQISKSTPKTPTTSIKKTDSHASIDDIMLVRRPKNIKKISVSNVMELINYLDQFPTLSKWRNNSAKYDDAYYSNLPLNVLTKEALVRITDLQRISRKTQKHHGHIFLKKNSIDIFGRC